MTIRYDDFAATQHKLDEDDLRLYHYQGSVWLDITDSLDTANNWIVGLDVSPESFFAVGAVPEPGALALLVIGAGALLRRRRGKYSR